MITSLLHTLTLLPNLFYLSLQVYTSPKKIALITYLYTFAYELPASSDVSTPFQGLWGQIGSEVLVNSLGNCKLVCWHDHLLNQPLYIIQPHYINSYSNQLNWASILIKVDLKNLKHAFLVAWNPVQIRCSNTVIKIL